jgi:transcription antitermination factor NusG
MGSYELAELWTIAYLSAPGEEVEERLNAGGFEVFSPLLWGTRRVGRETVPAPVALYPGYLFVRYCDDWARVYAVQGVVRLLGSPDSPVVVGEGFVRDLRERMEAGEGALRPEDNREEQVFEDGAMVRISAGAHTGYIGKVVGNSGPRGKVRIRLDYFGCSRVTSIPRHLLAPSL